MSQIADDSLASFVKESVRVCPPLVCVSAVRWTLLWTETEAAMFSRRDSSRHPGSPRRLGLRGTPTSDAQFHLPNAKSAHRHTGKNTGECRLMAARVWSRLNGHVYRFLYEEHMTVEVDGRKKNCPQWETSLTAPLLCASCCALLHSHKPTALFISPLSAFCLHASIWPCLSFYISFIVSLISFCTHTGTRARIHSLQKWEPVMAPRWEWADERGPICDWMTEWLKNEEPKQ